jgi:hypothetical protein
MLRSTPEFGATQRQFLADLGPQPGANEAIAQLRRKRRDKLRRWAKTLSRVNPLARIRETKLASAEPKPTSRSA